jgi:hypothetical protein
VTIVHVFALFDQAREDSRQVVTVDIPIGVAFAKCDRPASSDACEKAITSNVNFRNIGAVSAQDRCSVRKNQAEAFALHAAQRLDDVLHGEAFHGRGVAPDYGCGRNGLWSRMDLHSLAPF